MQPRLALLVAMLAALVAATAALLPEGRDIAPALRAGLAAAGFAGESIRPGAWLVLLALTGLGVGIAFGRMHRGRRRADARCRVLERQLTDASRALAELRLDNARLELAQQIAGVAVFEWDLEKGRIDWSPAMERTCGLEPGGFDGTFEQWRRLVHPDDLPRVVRALGDAIAGRSEFRIQFRVVRADGGHRWLSSRSRMLRDSAGRPCRLIGVNLDLTEEMQGVRGLRQSEEFFRLAADAHGGVVFDVDFPSGRLRQSRGLPQAFGWADDETTAADCDRWLERIHPDDAGPARERLREAVARGSQRVELCCRLRHRDGGWRPMLVRLMLVRDPQDDVVRLVGCAEDMTALRETDTMLQREAERRRADARATGTVELRSVVVAAAERERKLLRERGLQLSLALPAAGVEFDGEAGRLSQVFCSLLRHSADAAQAGSEIALDLKVLGKWAIVSVRTETGGFTAAERATMFDGPSALPEDVPDGADVALRLAQARGLVESHGGTLRAGSDGPGLGSCFTVTLPLAPEAARVAPTRVGTR